MTTKPERYDPKRPLITKRLMAWCAEQYGLPMLPQTIEPYFREYHVECLEQGKTKKYLDWPRAFHNFIKWASPAGRFHSAREWELYIKKAKALEYGARTRQTEPYHPNPGSMKEFEGVDPAKRDNSKQVAVAAMGRLKDMLNKAGL